jgi:exodeoxyribonuclease VII small subunit
MSLPVESDGDDHSASEERALGGRRSRGTGRGVGDPERAADGSTVARPARRPVGDLSYSEASAELDGIVALFERGEVDIDGLVEQLERATAIVEELDRRLERTKARVDELVPRLAAAARAGDDDPEGTDDI